LIRRHQPSKEPGFVWARKKENNKKSLVMMGSGHDPFAIWFALAFNGILFCQDF
jgi:hypothetical protein